jgi:hypothetical protein
MQFQTLRQHPPPTKRPVATGAPELSPLGEPTAAGLNAVDSWADATAQQNAGALTDYIEKLARIPTGMGRLAYLARLKKCLSTCQRQLFGEWLYLSLEEQCRDLERHAHDAAAPGARPDAWLSLPAYCELVPDSASEAEKQLYFGNLDVLLELIRAQARR